MADSDADPSRDTRPSVRLGSYLLIRQLGSGGMSNVFQAVHEESGSTVAVKVLPRTLAKNATLLQRFIREAKSAEALDHPNIAAIYDRGFDQGRHYLVLEYVEGRDLHDRVRLNGPLEPAEALRFVREVAEGLHYAAGRGMIHRDVKPANLLMTPEGHAKIIDLGLALQVEDEDERVTRDGTTVGTVDYMAPEQARDSRQTSERSDIYSLGCTFYYLLTGSPPFPGGGLADKLARHYKAPIPDPRQARPEVSESLSLLIRRMMEKKPDRRFADYGQLLAAFDAIGDPSGILGSTPIPLDALIDEEEDGIATGTTVASPSTLGYSMAEIVDDEDDEPTVPGFGKAPARRESRPTGVVTLAELAAIDADEGPATRRTARSKASVGPESRHGGPAFDDLAGDDEAVVGAGEGARRSSSPELSLQTWIAAGVMVGLAIAVVGFGVSMLVSFTKPKPPEVVGGPGAATDPEASYPMPAPRPRPTHAGPVRPTPVGPRPIVLPKPPAAEVAARPPALEESAYPGDWSSRLGPPATPSDPPVADRSRVVVRRAIEAGDEAQVSSLAAAFGRAAEVVEIADAGPFFEDDCQVAGKSRLIRARPGFRPIIKIEPAGQEVVKAQEAKFVLDGSRVEKLVLEGLDLAVDIRDLPEPQSTLFLCRGADLTLRDCTITLLNASDRKATRFSIFRLEEGARPGRLVLERSMIRGPIRTLVDLVAPRAEVVLDRSLVVGESGPLFSVEPADRSSRSLYLHRSVLGSRGPIVEFAARPAPLTVRALGSTFARIEGVGTSGLFQARSAFVGEPSSAIDWSGEDNAFVGWSAWLAAGPESVARVTGLDGVRASWPGSDGSSVESAGAWPSTLAQSEFHPDEIASLIPGRRATLARIAWPRPRLRELTFASIARLTAPELSASMIPPFIPPMPVPPAAPAVLETAPTPALVRPAFVPNPNGPVPKGPPRKAAASARVIGPDVDAAPPPQVDLAFDAQAAPWSGDLGQFLAEKVVPGTLRATVRIRGGGVYPMSPIRLPDGLSIAVLGEAAGGAQGPIPTFVPKPGADGRSMIELRGGDLALADLAFASEGPARPRHWVRVEDGLLGIRHCRFRDPGGPAPESEPVVSFVAKGASPITPRIGPFTSATDRPTARLKDCLIWTGGDAIATELGRGVVDLENCLILSGGSAVALGPTGVARDLFEVDLILERCTVVGDRAGVALGAWPGDPAGPDRPWLVSTRSCVFPRAQVGGSGALLLVDPAAMARGVLFWQSSFDAYEVSRFLGSIGPPPPNPPPADLKRGWVDLWGAQHARGDRGPDPRRIEHVLRYKDRPRPGRAAPGSFELDPKNQKDLGVDFKALPAAPRS